MGIVFFSAGKVHHFAGAEPPFRLLMAETRLLRSVSKGSTVNTLLNSRVSALISTLLSTQICSKKPKIHRQTTKKTPAIPDRQTAKPETADIILTTNHLTTYRKSNRVFGDESANLCIISSCAVMIKSAEIVIFSARELVATWKVRVCRIAESVVTTTCSFYLVRGAFIGTYLFIETLTCR